MNRRDVITGLVVLVVIILGIVLINRYRNRIRNAMVVPTATPSIEQKIQETFNGMPLPTSGARIELKDTSGGDSFGITTETEVLADLPEPPEGEFYQGWIDNNGTYLSLGKLRTAKGGYILSGNLKDKKVVVSREKIFDNTLEVKILE